MNHWPCLYMEKTAKRLEAFETPEWAVEAILDAEIMTNSVLDPCCGTGILGNMARDRGHSVFMQDVYRWPGAVLNRNADFLNGPGDCPFDDDFTVFMNPPFSLACEFVERSLELGARKIVCFQRWAWYESSRRKAFWDKCPPNRIYMCGNRASCWRFDIPPEKRKKDTTTAHAWFVWERGHPPGTTVSRIYRKEGK